MTSDIPILIETSDFIAIDKPAGLSVHNDDAGGHNVLQLFGKDLYLPHRLDKETSGVLILTKSKQATTQIAFALQSKSAQKQYRAILRGNLTKNLGTPSSHPVKWQWAISDKAEGRQNPQGKSADRLTAETQIHIIKSTKYFTDIQAQILTGRQHQIRKHSALAQHPIVGDPRYNDKSYNQKMFSRYHFERMMLHAETLQIDFDGEPLTIQAPLPNIFNLLLEEPSGDH